MILQNNWNTLNQKNSSTNWMIFWVILPKIRMESIPDANGQIVKIEKQLLSECTETKQEFVLVKDTSSEFLKYLDKQGIALGSKMKS
jgi:hypothetical protein